MAGSPSDATSMSPGRHSGVWVDHSKHLCLRLAQRKNRPQGSLLRRPCICVGVANPLCVVCRVRTVLARHGPGHRLFNYTADRAVTTLRRMLTLLGVTNAQGYTLKAFRAGKATALAASGKSLGHILAAGEWRSSAFLSYVDTDVVDQAQLLDATLEASGDESEH